MRPHPVCRTALVFLSEVHTPTQLSRPGQEALPTETMSLLICHTPPVTARNPPPACGSGCLSSPYSALYALTNFSFSGVSVV